MLMSNENRKPEPETVPPPNGARDMYSAATRIGTLPEEVLAAMRTEAPDAALDARTSIMEIAAIERLRPPPAISPPVEEMLIHPELDQELEPEPPPLVVRPDPFLRSSLFRSLVVVSFFALLGGIVAAAITLW